MKMKQNQTTQCGISSQRKTSWLFILKYVKNFMKNSKFIFKVICTTHATVRNDVCWHMHTSDITCDIYVHCCFCINDNVCTELHPLCTFLQNNKQWRCCFNWVPLLFWYFMPHVWQNKAREFTEFLCKTI